MKRKRYLASCAENEWGSSVANLLNRYSKGESLTPNLPPIQKGWDLNKLITMPTVSVEPTPETLKIIKYVGFGIAGALVLSAIIKHK